MNGIVTVSCLGNLGRFGNQCFQWAVSKAYAESIGAELCTPNWIGRELFQGATEDLMSCPAGYRFADENLDGSTNRDLWGYFQRQDHLKLLSRKKLKEWFKPKPQWVRGGHELCVHKRRGDYIEAGCFALVSNESYETAVKQYGYSMADAAVYDDSRPVDKTYDDFFEIMHSKRIFRSNSTFSWWACTLSDAKVYSPVVGDKSGWGEYPFVEGNHPGCMYLFQDFTIGE